MGHPPQINEMNSLVTIEQPRPNLSPSIARATKSGVDIPRICVETLKERSSQTMDNNREAEKRNVSGMKPQDTIVSLGVQMEEEERTGHIPTGQCCCGTVSVQRGSRIVAVLSFVALLANAILYFFGFSRLGLNTYIELLVLLFDFIAVICLFIGTSGQRPAMLKPYLFFMSLWSLALCLLFLSCTWKLVKGRGFARNAVRMVMNIRGEERGRHARHGNGEDDCLVALLLVASLALLILIDCFFLHVVYRAFQFFSYKEDKAREEECQRNQRQNGRPMRTQI